MTDRNPIELITPARLKCALAHHIGAGNGISARDLVKQVTGDPEPNPAGERRLRDLIVEMRISGQHICATPTNGYFMAETTEELEKTCAYLKSRAMTGLMQVSAMTRISLPDLVGQQKLPT
tara:strand:+ start:154 stop:516 length:363 start_codon:yes stop_codon:yes gene_type:complete